MGFLSAGLQDFLVKHSGDTLRGNIQFSGKAISVLQPNGTNTTYSVTKAGEKAFSAHIDALEKMIRMSK